ncbi:MAG: FecR domain-containing protein [Spirochaetota bacterium]
MQTMGKKIVYYSLFISILGILPFCKKPVDKIKIQKQSHKDKNHLSAVVVFSTGDAKISHADLTEERAKIGAYFQSGDTIATESNSKVDIQIGGESVVRIAPNSHLSFTTLRKTKTSATAIITLDSGKIYANIDKLRTNDNYTFLTPFSFAKIKGTSFIIESKDTKSTIKVVEGEVTFSPYLPKRIIDSGNPYITKIQEKLLATQTLIPKGKQASLQPNDDIFLQEAGKTQEVQNAALLKKLKQFSQIQVMLKPLDIIKKEEQELSTIIKIEPTKSYQIIDLNEKLSSGIIDESQAEKYEKERKQIETEISKMQEVKKSKFNDTIVANPKSLKSKQEIIKYYERMEKIILKSGRIEIGAIIDQLGTSKIVVHTENGIKRIPMEFVKEIIYDFKASSR